MRFLSVYKDLRTKGELTSPRGQKVLEIQDYMLTMGPRDRFTSYKARKFNLDYAKFEMLWYLTGDPYNDMIMKSASMWEGLRQPDGSWYSNYGQYWFAAPQFGFDWAVSMLLEDKDTRQAVIPMLRYSHLFHSNRDIVCTESISFRIRDNRLYMSVNMRSQDAMWGFTNDIFCFSILHEMVYTMLVDKYDGLIMGPYTHKVDSFHVYERHFEMLDQIIDEGQDGYYEVYCPMMYDKTEVVNLIEFKVEDSDSVNHLFTEWINDNKYSDKDGD
ncbi:MAG: thymidylate synthase [Acidimicrobiia bacterium]|nr:thymidylate synthase [Acidimicrobiia bacterium]